MSTIDLRPRLKRRRARHQPRATVAPAALASRQRLITFEYHESGRWLALEVLLRSRDAGPPFALRDEHGELRLTIGQLEQLVLAAGPAALARYRQQEAALLAGGLDAELAPQARDERSLRRVVVSGATAPAGAPASAAAALQQASA